MSRVRPALMEKLWQGAELEYRAKLLDALPTNPTIRLLDVGCDDGAWTEQLCERIGIETSRALGLELVPERAELARDRGIDVRVCDLEEQWPLDDESVDVVHANQVLEHVKRLDHFVRETRRVLAGGGLAVACTENLASWHNIGALVLGLQPFSLTNISERRPIGNPFALHAGEPSATESMQHVHVVAYAALRDLFVAHGFAIERAWGAGYHPFSGRAARWLAAHDARHAHFIGIAARVRPSST